MFGGKQELYNISKSAVEYFVIEDDNDVKNMWVKLFSVKKNILAHDAGGVIETLALLKTMSPELYLDKTYVFVIDYELKDGNGVQLANQIRINFRDIKAVMIIVTGQYDLSYYKHLDELEREKARGITCNTVQEILEKPICFDVLMKTIEKYL